jgi:hypothetical protein
VKRLKGLEPSPSTRPPRADRVGLPSVEFAPGYLVDRLATCNEKYSVASRRDALVALGRTGEALEDAERAGWLLSPSPTLVSQVLGAPP